MWDCCGDPKLPVFLKYPLEQECILAMDALLYPVNFSDGCVLSWYSNGPPSTFHTAQLHLLQASLVEEQVRSSKVAQATAALQATET